MLNLSRKDVNEAANRMQEFPLAWRQLERAISKSLEFGQRVYRKAPRQWELINKLSNENRMKEAEDLRMELLINLGMVEEARRIELKVKRVFDYWTPEFSKKLYKDSRLIQS